MEPKKRILVALKNNTREGGADVEIVVYLGILDTRKFLGSQKIWTKITAILSRKWL